MKETALVEQKNKDSTGCDAITEFSTIFNGATYTISEYILEIERTLSYIDFVEVNSDTIVIHISIEYINDFFKSAGFMNFNWSFCRYHDIYSNLFKYETVKGVKVLTENRNITYLPCIGEYDDIIPEGGVFKTEWYNYNLDYGTTIYRDDFTVYKNFDKKSIKSCVLDSVFNIN